MKNTALSGIRLRKPREILENWNKDFEKWQRWIYHWSFRWFQWDSWDDYHKGAHPLSRNLSRYWNHLPKYWSHQLE
jgi:hypothetical protein